MRASLGFFMVQWPPVRFSAEGGSEPSRVAPGCIISERLRNLLKKGTKKSN